MAVVLIQTIVYMVVFTISIYALSGLRFDVIMNVREPKKAWVLILLLAMALSYLVSQFLFAFTIYR